jgi:antitoxin PrlF
MEENVMEISRITSKGQITIPVDIRKKLNLKTGDKVVFIEEGGKIIFANSSMIALREFQHAMKGEAEKQGIYSEDDVNKLVKDIRKELWETKHADLD